MTVEEFSNEFDVLVNSYAPITQQGLEIDDYEKSVLLTLAQEGLVIELYKGGTLMNMGFEVNEESRRYLASLVKTDKLSPKEEVVSLIQENSYVIDLPDDVLYITFEKVSYDDDLIPQCKNEVLATVVPVTQDSLYNTINNPFKGVDIKRVLRLDTSSDDSQQVELISKYKIKEYIVRYIKKPDPIILIDLPDGLTINKKTKKQECLLDSSLHRTILERAVQIAMTIKRPLQQTTSKEE